MKIALAVAMTMTCGIVHAKDLCAANPYTPAEAQLGKVAFESRCAQCHQFSMMGREPGNAANESPDITTLSKSDLDFMMDDSGGVVPALVGKKFFDKHKAKTLTEFSAFVSSAAIAFPTANMKIPDTYFHIAAYILYRNCEGDVAQTSAPTQMKLVRSVAQQPHAASRSR